MQVKNVAFTSTEDDVVLALLSGSDEPVKVDVKVRMGLVCPIS